MFDFSWNWFKIIWTTLCGIATIATIISQTLNYAKSDDVTVVEFKRFHNNEMDLYPSLTLCFSRAFNLKELEKYGKHVTALTYSLFLSGQLWNQDMLQIDYYNVSLNFHDFILAYGVTTNKWETIMHYDASNNNTTTSKKPQYQEFSLFGMKCFTVNIPFEKGQKLVNSFIMLKTDIFPLEIRPSNSHNPLAEHMFIFLPHYPKQSFEKINVGQTNWPARGQNSTKNYVMEFNIRSMEIFQQRNKYKQLCTEGIPDYDGHITQWIMKKVGCKPPYWASISSLPLCSTFEEMKLTFELILSAMSGDLHSEYDTGILPCRSLEKIQYDHRDIDLPETNPPTFTIQLNFREVTYKEIKSVRNTEMLALIGNVGGYLGLFLGYALLHLPDLFLFLYNWIAQRIPVVLNIITSRKHRKTSSQGSVENGIKPNDRRRQRSDRWKIF